MTMPTVTVEVGFDSHPTVAIGSTSWTDITDYVTGIDLSRGRRRELEQFAAGVCTVTLEDPDGRFNPANTAGAYWPNVKPMKRIRVRVTDPTGYSDEYADEYGGGTYTIFSGFVDKWPQAWPQAVAMPVVIHASDGLKWLASEDLPDSVYEWEVSQDTPVTWFKLSEPSGTVAVNAGSDGINGEYAGSPNLGASSLVEHDTRTSADFDGVNDQLWLPRNQTQVGATGLPFTVEFLMNYDRVVNPVPPGANPQSFLARQGRAFVIVLSPTSSTEDPARVAVSEKFDLQTAFSDPLSAGTDYHIVVECTSSGIAIYVNNVDLLSSTASAPQDSYDGIVIGTDKSEFSGSYDPYDGRLQHFAIYDGVLTSARRTAHYTARTAPWNGDTSGERIGRILDLTGWPSADRDLDTGATTFGDADISGFTALGYIQLCEQSENGYFYITRDGNARLIERHALITETTYNTSQVTLSDDPGAGEFVYESLNPNYDDRVFNEVTVQRKYGVDQTAADTTSQTAYTRRSLDRDGLLMDTDTEALAAAQWLLEKFKDPRIEIDQVDLAPDFDDGLWQHVLGLDLMARVTVERTPHSGGDTFSQQAHIQGISHRIVPAEKWETSWFLSPADTTGYLILDDATYGKLDSNALAY